jgi:cephalosporin hydroxylase
MIANDISNIVAMQADDELKRLKDKLYLAVAKYKYTYNFVWLGRPVIQFPQDLMAMQELIFYASMLELAGSKGRVLGIDIDIRKHNRIEIEKHPMFKRIMMLEGSSIDGEIVEKVRNIAKDKKPVLVVLDSNHTHEHVLKELKLYSPLVTEGSYIVVFDTLIEDMPDDVFSDRQWGKGNNPKTAVKEFLKTSDRFVIDKEIENKLLITVSPDGYLKCVKEK